MQDVRYERPLTCVQFESELEAFLEGESRPFVSAHARACEFCGCVLADLEQLRDAARAIPLEEPSPTVWANLRARLEREGILRERATGWAWLRRLHVWPHPAPLGALASVVLVGVFVLMASPTSRLSPLRTEGRHFSPPAPVASLLGPDQAADLTRVIRDLETAYQSNSKNLAPDVKASYDKGLDSLNESIRESLASLQQEPDNALAHEYLMDAYSRKAEVLSSALEFGGR